MAPIDAYLEKAAWTPIKRHNLITYDYSPDNPNLREYWEKREKAQAKKTAEGRLPKGKNKIALRQKYTCPYCGQPLGDYNQVHLHHIIPRSEGGEDKYNNLVYVHEDCHKTIHALGASNPQIQETLFRAIKALPKQKPPKSQKVQKRSSKE
ncbi:HNH endonuclease [Moorena sp. SIO4G3]|uniref:HNH endonuclease n=1 Tax=Moorena sp. SIO4G3 TaxID=2607821 RepID=UPI0025CF376A|nr:HNH endonuclease [Moorena sp. SIO4G3]